MSPPSSVSPEPAFIAASAASQIVTNDHDSHAETWYDQHGIEPSSETATVSPAALQLVNGFLDQLLFNFLSVSRSTTLSALRPAVSEVLKPKLAKDAINQADEELREYLGGDEEDSALAQAPGSASTVDWDLELAWKRTRLRCMVYSSLGDMEEEDEDYYMEQGHLDAGLEDRFSEAVSPAVAIFLTSILEFVGEQALIIAGQAAYHRMRLKCENEQKEGARTPTGVADKTVVEELDMERVALDRTLGRLWRSWKKKIRSPAIGSMDRLNRSYSKDSLRTASGHVRSPSSTAELGVPATVPEPDAEIEAMKIDLEGQENDGLEPLEEYLVAAGIPLPTGPNDVAEIEIPGLALCQNEDKHDGGKNESRPPRPRSMMLLPLKGTADSLTSTSSQLQASRRRSNSLPTPAPARHFTTTSVQREEPHAVASAEAPAAAADSLEGSQTNKAEPGTTVSDDVGTGPVQGNNEDEDDDDDDDDEVSIEEPRIVRSSRVSILGRSPSTTSSEQGKPIAINTNLPVRTPSIHSARLIDVGTPRSPAVGSQRSSVVAAESVRHTSPARAARTVTPPISDEQAEPSLDSVSGSRLAVNHAHKSGLTTNVSISHIEGPAHKDHEVSPVAAITPATQAEPIPPAASPPVSKERYESAEPTPGSHIREPSTPPKPCTAKVTVLPPTSSAHSTSSSASSIFYIESMPALPEAGELKEEPHIDSHNHGHHPPAEAPPPALPERRAGRQAVANTSALRQPATIGQVSVERSRPRSASQGSSSRPRDASAGWTRQQPAPGSPTASTKLKAVRTSEEAMQGRIDVVRNFEELIQSDQTIQFTLTPESMRDIDSRSARSIALGSPVVPVKTRRSEDARPTGSRSRSSSVTRNDARTPPARRSSGSGSRSSNDAHPTSRNFPTGTGKHGGLVPRSIPLLPSKQRANGPQARDASMTTGTVRNQEYDSTISIDAGRASTTSNPNRPKLQARGAAVDCKDDNSDLIDFIRRGPPGPGCNPRIPRNVAPFRTTMDSDQLSSAVGGRAIDAQLRDVELRSSQASTPATESSLPPSVQSSVNSHSALLAKSKSMTYDTADGDMPIPKRKTRRVRDPYAIDLSDEELYEDDETPPQPKKKVQTQEESLIDFLNNYTPPPEPVVKPFNIAQTRNMTQQKANNSLKPKKSAQSLMARLTRRDSAQSGNFGSNQPMSPKVPALPSASGSLNSRASGGKGGHIPIQLNIPNGSDLYSSPSRTSSKPAAMMGGAPVPIGARRVPMKKFEPREPISVPTRATSELADFFKNSAPPAGPTTTLHQLSGSVEREEASSVSRVWGRRRKASMS
ncbi:hypothetical protein VTI74DRAFT_8076 [Chaetomium olivicolor]